MLPMTLSLAANETQRHQRVGRTVFAKSLTGEIEVTGWSSGGIIVGRGRLVQGNKITMAADFTTLEIKDISGSTNSVDLLAGLGDFSEAGLGTIDSITDPVTVQSGLPAGVTVSEIDAAGGPISNPWNAGSAPNGVDIYGAHVHLGSTAAASDIGLVAFFFGGNNFELVRCNGPSSSKSWVGHIEIPGSSSGTIQVSTEGGASIADANCKAQVIWQARP